MSANKLHFLITVAVIFSCDTKQESVITSGTKRTFPESVSYVFVVAVSISVNDLILYSSVFMQFQFQNTERLIEQVTAKQRIAAHVLFGA